MWKLLWAQLAERVRQSAEFQHSITRAGVRELNLWLDKPWWDVSHQHRPQTSLETHTELATCFQQHVLQHSASAAQPTLGEGPEERFLTGMWGPTCHYSLRSSPRNTPQYQQIRSREGLGSFKTTWKWVVRIIEALKLKTAAMVLTKPRSAAPVRAETEQWLSRQTLVLMWPAALACGQANFVLRGTGLWQARLQTRGHLHFKSRVCAFISCSFTGAAE